MFASYDQDHRPTKRPRATTTGGGGGRGETLHPNLNGLAMEDMRIGIGIGMGTGDGFKNTRQGHQQQQPQQQSQQQSFTSSSSSTPTATMHRGRTDDKNNRKLSCKECRRLKLKCDRVFPCQSCVKRGCGTLCPEGALTSGRGSRFILAGAEQLHEKIFQLSDRVRQLEDGLEILQSQCSNQTHPLLSPELLKIKTSQELYGTMINNPPPTPSTSSPSAITLGTLRESDNNIDAPSPRGGDLMETTSPTTMTTEQHKSSSGQEILPPDVAPDILQLSTTFPFPWMMDISIRKRIRDSLPPKAEAQRICEEARANALWQFNMDASETFLPNLLHYCYSTPIDALSPRRLALLLMHLSIGSLVDLSRPLGSLYGEAYHHLARAAVCEIPLMEEPDFDVLHALFFMIWYHLIFSDNKKAVGYAWNLMGFVAKLAQGLGLHRDAPRMKCIPEEDEKRRSVFWELLNMDCRMSLSLGRPPSIQLAHVDIKPPTCVGPGLYVPREEIVYHEWKNNFFIQCLTPMLEAMVAVVPPDYSHVINLDKSVRDFGVPALLDDHKPHTVSPRFLVMQRGLVAIGRELALLQLHRRYFTDAMGCPEGFGLSHPYAPSVIATYISASNLISAVETLFEQEQQLSARFLHFWFNTFSAVVTLSLLISRAPSNPLAVYAFQDMERGCRLFRSAAKILPFSGKSLPVMQKLVEKSRRVLRAETAHNMYAGFPSPPQPVLPASFTHVHELISQYAVRIESRSVMEGMGSATSPDLVPPFLTPSEAPVQQQQQQQQNPWLPDLYRFSSVGLSVEERYTFASAQPTPFIPSSPRVAEDKNFNFDHGALTTELVEETSYMAWF